MIDLPDLDLPAILDRVVTIAEQAGNAILEIYAAGFDVDLKDDGSPLTEADVASHRLITASLGALTPDIPILSEESAEQAPYELRRAWRRFWLVDPLDGTKEFVRRNGEFTVNVALIEDGVPILGVVHAPVLSLTYAAVAGRPAVRLREGGSELIQAESVQGDMLRVVASRSHAGPETDRFLDALRSSQPVDLVSRGSALKICLVADGTADLYPRLGPTMEWDTAAAHAVAEAAGAHIVGRDGVPLRYNKQDLRNPHFLVSAAALGPFLDVLRNV